MATLHRNRPSSRTPLRVGTGLATVLLVGLGLLAWQTRDLSRGAWSHSAPIPRQVSAAEMASKINSLSHLATFLAQQVAQGHVAPAAAAHQLQAGLRDARSHWEKYRDGAGVGSATAQQLPASSESVDRLFTVVADSIPQLEEGRLEGLEGLRSVGTETAAD